MKVKDSKENELFFNYQLKVLEYKTLLSEYENFLKNKELDSALLQEKKTKKLSVEKELNQFVEANKTKNKGTYLAKILSAMDSPGFEQFPFSDSELLRTPFYHNYIRLFIKKNIEKHSSYIMQETDNFLDSLKKSEQCFRYTAGYLLNFYNNFYRNGINSIFVHIADKYFLPDKAGWLGNNELEQIKKRRDFLAQGLPGNQAQDLIMESNTGEYLSLLQVTAKTTFLYFWSTGCGHCTKATQILNENYKALKEKNIEIYAVNVEKNKEDWLKKIEENNLLWINCMDVNEDSDYRDKYYVYGSPLLFIIDTEKKINAVFNGEIEIENAVKQILK
jgi:thiol-disulfide isomerase/thioredoxin